VLLLRISFLLIICFLYLFADIKIFATKATYENNTLILKNPLIIYNGSIIQAKKGIVTDKRKIVLKKNVLISYKNNSSVISADSLIAFSSKNIGLQDVFFYDRNIDGWLLSKSSKSKNQNISFKKVYFSTCCINNPDWFMKASGATYNRNTKGLKLYNLTLVINKVPILYLPYFYVNFDKTRRSGLLQPYIGYSENEGILYSQPIYFATSINTDLEITPTIRALRGNGIYSIFRFVDSPYSKGSIKAGFFKDYIGFYKENNLAHQKHYGYNLKYERSRVFDVKDSLYLDLKYANDVDYFYLDAYNYRFNDVYLSDKLITSELNYIYNTQNYLSGVYFKYFIDTTKLSNDTTWQILPQLNFHKFLTKNYGFLNSFDFNMYNYYRKKGSNYLLSDLLLPVSLNFSFFNEYLKVKLSEQLNAGYGFYYQTSSLKSKYINLSTQIKLYTSLTKYDDYVHIISPSILINIKNYSKASIYSSLMSAPELQNYIFFKLFQIFENKNLKITHTLNETYYLDLNEYSDLENIFDIKYNSIHIIENNKYSIKYNYIKYNNFKISYNNIPFNVFLAHVYEKDSTQSITLGASYNINKYKKIYSEYSYDINQKYNKYWLFGVKLNKKCWDYDFSFKQTRIPILEEEGISYKKDNIISINVELKPIGGLNQTFIFKGNK
jgi:LPS-assembly protein